MIKVLLLCMYISTASLTICSDNTRKGVFDSLVECFCCCAPSDDVQPMNTVVTATFPIDSVLPVASSQSSHRSGQAVAVMPGYVVSGSEDASAISVAALCNLLAENRDNQGSLAVQHVGSQHSNHTVSLPNSNEQNGGSVQNGALSIIAFPAIALDQTPAFPRHSRQPSASIGHSRQSSTSDAQTFPAPAVLTPADRMINPDQISR